MIVHIFGATSSPSCANFVMRKHAENNEQVFGPDVVRTVLETSMLMIALSHYRQRQMQSATQENCQI